VVTGLHFYFTILQKYFLRTIKVVPFWFSCLSFSVWLSFHKLAHNGLRTGDRNHVLRLRQSYGACALLWAG